MRKMRKMNRSKWGLVIRMMIEAKTQVGDLNPLTAGKQHRRTLQIKAWTHR